jgi:ketosteroid isomerase-like protein
VVSHRLWNAICDGDPDGIRGILSPRIQWRSYGAGDLSGIFTGAEAVLDLLASAGDLVDEINSKLIDVFSSENGAVLRYTVDAYRGSKEIHLEHILVLEIRDELIVEAVSIPSEQKYSGAFWSLEPNDERAVKLNS